MSSPDSLDGVLSHLGEGKLTFTEFFLVSVDGDKGGATKLHVSSGDFSFVNLTEETCTGEATFTGCLLCCCSPLDLFALFLASKSAAVTVDFFLTRISSADSPNFLLEGEAKTEGLPFALSDNFVSLTEFLDAKRLETPFFLSREDKSLGRDRLLVLDLECDLLDLERDRFLDLERDLFRLLDLELDLCLLRDSELSVWLLFLERDRFLERERFLE